MFWTKHYEDGVPNELRFEEITVVDFLERSASRFPNNPAVTLKGKTLTYRELKNQVDRFATGLTKLGVKKDTKVALWMPNIPQMVISYYAVLKLGAQVVMTNPLYVEREVIHQFNDSGAEVVVTCDFLWHYKLKGVMDKVPELKNVVVTSIPDYLKWPLNWLAPLKLKKTKQFVKVPIGGNVHSFTKMIAENTPILETPELKLDDLAMLQYTGGTTGVSKGAMLTHRNISVNAQQCMSWFVSVKLGHEVLLACLPYFHVFGMTVSLNWPVFAGAHIVLMPNPRDIPDMVKNIEKYKVTLYPSLPALYNAINSFPNIDKRDLSSVRCCFSGSAPLPVDVLEKFEELTGGRITEGFGLTETSPATHVNPLFGLRKPGSVGIPLPGTEMKVVDIETGTKTLPLGAEGELCLKGPQVMKGYWQRPYETEEVLKDGWLYTGDLARIDDDGFTFIVGRKKDMILSCGYNIYPDEIDSVLFAHPDVMEAATIGVPDKKRGETVKSYVVLKPEATSTVEDIVAHCRRDLAPYKVPRNVEILDSIPKSSMMKILRTELRSREVSA